MSSSNAILIRSLAALGCLCVVQTIPVLSQNNIGTAAGPGTRMLQNDTTAGALFHEFLKFKMDFNKVYQSVEHEAERFVHFVNNLHFIRNFKSAHIELGINQFADLSNSEFKAQYLGFRRLQRSQRSLNQTNAALTAQGSHMLWSIPDSIDWVSKGAVTAVKNQRRARAPLHSACDHFRDRFNRTCQV